MRCSLTPIGSTCKPESSEFSVNNTFFVKRQNDLERFISSPLLRDAYLALQRWMNRGTRTCYPEHRRVAEVLGCSVRTVQRRLRALEAIGVIITLHRKQRGCRNTNLSNHYTFPLLNDDFLMCRGVGVKSVMVKRETKIEEQATTPGAGAPRPIHDWKPDPPRPKPDPEVVAAVEQAKQFRRAQWRSHHQRERFVPSADNFGPMPEDQRAKYAQEMEATLDRLQPGWREEVGYGL